MPTLKPALAYFAIVFAAGFVLGTLRVLWLMPRLGERAAELAELPLMLLVVMLAAGWINRRFPEPRGNAARLLIGLTATAILLSIELLLVAPMRGLSPVEAVLARDPVSGTAYCLSLLVFALAPWLLSRRASGNAGR